MTADTPAPKRGRPTLYTDELAEEICQRLQDRESLNSICKDDHMPDESTVRLWAVENYRGFSPKYARAREIGYLGLADELIDIADDARNDWMDKQTRNGTVREVDEECVKRSQLRVDTRKWVLSKMLPKVYGDKLTTEHQIGFTQEFEDFIRALNAGEQAKVINGISDAGVSDTSVSDTSGSATSDADAGVRDTLAAEGSPMGRLPAPVRS